MDPETPMNGDDEVVRELDVFLCNGCVDAQVGKEALILDRLPSGFAGMRLLAAIWVADLRR